MDLRSSRFVRGAFVAVGFFVVTSSVARAQQRVVHPGGPWVSDTRGSNGFAQITGNNPRNGNGSLELGVSGDPNDWGFFNLFSNDPFGFGQLSALSQVSFDWYRVGMPPVGDPVWQVQTPALRLNVRSGPTN